MPSFHEGGWGMVPTFILGVLLVAVAVKYATSADRRLIPVTLGLGAATLLAGSLGFVTGLIRSIRSGMSLPPDERYVAWIGLGESLHNVALALLMTVVAAMAVSLGAWRSSRAPSDLGNLGGR